MTWLKLAEGDGIAELCFQGFEILGFVTVIENAPDNWNVVVFGIAPLCVNGLFQNIVSVCSREGTCIGEIHDGAKML